MNNANPSTPTIAHPITKVSNPPNLDEAKCLLDEYLQAEFSLVQLNGKKPFETGWPAKQGLPLDQALKWLASGNNLGMRTGAASGGVYALDVDKGWDAFVESNEERLQSVRRTKTSEGRGRVLVRGQGWGPVAKGQDWGEVLGDGAQCVVPPSIHPDSGQPYTWEGDPSLSMVLEIEPEDLTFTTPLKMQARPSNLTEGEWETLKQLRLILGCDEDHIDKNKEAWFICPLHPPDRTPSFSYNLSTNRFSCFHEIGKLKGCWLGDLRRKLQPASGGRPTPTVEIISGDDLIAEPINETPTILNPHIPVGGITLLFGPPGVGKTALNWALGNAIVKGEDFLGHQTIKGQMLFVSLDMNNTLCKIRLHNTGFVPKFDFVFSDLPVDCLSSNFKGTELYKKVREKVTETSYALIVIDALGRLGRFDMSADNIPSQVYGSLREWLPGQTFLINHHSRKQKFNYKGDLIRRSMEDAFGSQFWTAYAASVVQLHRTGSQNGTLLHVKSQVLELADPISVCIDPESSTVCLLEDRKKVTAKSRMKLWEQKAKVLFPAWDSMGVEEQVKALRKVSGKSRRTIYTCLEELKKGGSEV